MRFCFLKKNAYQTIPIYGICMTGVFLLATQKNFQAVLKLPPKIFLYFFNCKSNFVREQTFSKFFCMQILFFFAKRSPGYKNVVTFLFRCIIVFQKRSKFLILLVWHVYVISHGLINLKFTFLNIHL